MLLKYYDFAKEFTRIPGPRYKDSGEHSGEEFRSIIEELLKEYDVIEIDGTDIISQFDPSFLNEAFNPILKSLGQEEFFQRVRLFSRNNKQLEARFRDYSRLDMKVERKRNVLEAMV